MKVDTIIYKMLTENTGRHFLDSGGSKNRNWQRNENKSLLDFENENEQSYEVDTEYNSISRTVSVYHYLAGSGSNLELDDICNEFNKLQEKSKNDSSYADFEVCGVLESGANYLESLYDFKIINTWNTYNGDSDLSQVLQGANLEINGDSYVLIQIHGGCDVRGGYTDAKLFKLNEFQGGINEYLMEYMDDYYLEDELEYIDEMTDYWDSKKVYKGAELDKIKQKIINS